VPRRTKTIFPRAVIESHLRARGSDMLEWQPRNGETPPSRRIKGWRWRCGCTAFALPEDRALWVPCVPHHPLLEAAEQSEPS